MYLDTRNEASDSVTFAIAFNLYIVKATLSGRANWVKKFRTRRLDNPFSKVQTFYLHL